MPEEGVQLRVYSTGGFELWAREEKLRLEYMTGQKWRKKFTTTFAAHEMWHCAIWCSWWEERACLNLQGRGEEGSEDADGDNRFLQNVGITNQQRGSHIRETENLQIRESILQCNKLQWRRRKIPAFRVWVLLLIAVSKYSAQAYWNTGIRILLLHYTSHCATRRQNNASCGDQVCPIRALKSVTKPLWDFHEIRYTNSLQKKVAKQARISWKSPQSVTIYWGS
jgi:hypothetical protein